MSLINIKQEPRRGGWRGKLLWVGVVVAVLLTILYFVGTSEAFLKRAILPQVSNALKADVTVAGASISPFRQVVVKELKVHPRGSEPLAAIGEIRLRYSLFSIIRGKIEVAEVVVESPVITVVENADGTRNIDELLKLGGPDEQKKPPTESGPAPSVDIKLVSLNNATVRLVKKHLDGTSDVVEVSGLNFSVRDVKNGQSGKMEVAASLAVNQAAQAAVAAGALRAKLGGGFTFDLAADLTPGSIKGDTTFTVEQATGALADLGALGVRFNCEATPTEVKEVALRFTKAAETLGEVRVSGPLDLAKLEGKLKLEVASLDRRVLNLAGAASGIDFGPTTINSTTDLELTKAGQEISVAGRLNVANFQITRMGKTSPTLDVRCDYAVTVDQAAEKAVLKFLNLSGTQNSKLFLQSELPSPLTIAWGAAGGATSGDANFNLTVTDWNLADWQAFAGETAPAGLLNTQLKLASQQGGKQLQLALGGGIKNFSLTAGGNPVQPAEVSWQMRAQAIDLKQFKLEETRFEISHQGQAAVVVSASGTFDGATQDADLSVTAQAALARLLAIAPQPGVSVSAGTVDFKGHIVGKGGAQTITGQFALTDFTGAQGDLRFANYGASVDFDVAMKDNTVELRKVTGLVREGQKPGGRFNADGKFDLGDQVSGRAAVKLVDFNQDGLRPFLEAALGGKKLVSVALNTTAIVNLGATGDMGIKADLQVTNLVVSDPKNPQPAKPLEARVQVDATATGGLAQIRQCQLTLTPTDRAKNELNLTGQVDSSKPEAITGSLKLSAVSLDVTRYYDLVAGTPPAATPAQTPQPAPAPAPEQEPEAMVLPLQNFTFDVDIGRFYLRELDIANLQAKAQINGGLMVLKPCQMTINGAPVNVGVDADLGVPGYRYQVSFNAQALPLAPFVNTFEPSMKGQIAGQFTSQVELQGAGITGGSLQKNLAGQFNVLTTNLNLSINHVRNPILNTIINVVVGLPELIRNPASLLTKLDPTQKSGWTDEITAKPIDAVLIQGTAGNGRIDVQSAGVHSAAFRAQTSGEIALATILTNSTLQLPVQLALGRAYAGKIGLVKADAPTNEVYVVLPDFLKLKGTVGAPKTDFDLKGVTMLAATVGGGLGKQLGLAPTEAGKGILEAGRNLLLGTTNSPSTSETNKVAEPAKPGGLLDLFKRPK